MTANRYSLLQERVSPRRSLASILRTEAPAASSLLKALEGLTNGAGKIAQAIRSGSFSDGDLRKWEAKVNALNSKGLSSVMSAIQSKR